MRMKAPCQNGTEVTGFSGKKEIGILKTNHCCDDAEPQEVVDDVGDTVDHIG
tara:strand:+ start:120 stop:275 length:156 start_codon:yes stop_codon:yes gene_type:complete